MDNAPIIAADAQIVYYQAYLYGSTVMTYLVSFGLSLDNSDAEVTIAGGGHLSSPFKVTNDYLTTSSFKST